MTLSHRKLKELYLALIEAFPTTVSLEKMLLFELGKNLRAIAGEGILEDTILKLIQTAKSEGWVEDLVRAAHDTNPGNQALFVFHTQLLEVINNPITKYFDNQLVPILQEIDFQTCKNVSKKVLPDLDLHLSNFSIKNVDDLRELFLEKYSRKLSNGNVPIIKFADCLANDNKLEKPVRQKFRIWVEKVTKELGLSYLFDCQMETSQIFNSYLLFFIKPQDNQLFYINAYLIPNEQDKEIIEPLYLEVGQNGILCSYNEIKNKIALLIRKSEEKLIFITDRPYELTVEFFWTIDYLHEEVEHWKLADAWDEFYLGESYKVVVRSYDRLEQPKLILALRKGRDRLKKFRAEVNEQVIDDIIENLKEVDNWKELKNRLEEKIALRLTCSLPVSEKERTELFKAIVFSGIPIAMWTRTTNITNICLEDEIQKFYNVGSLKDFSLLFELLQKERKNAYAKKECEKYLGYHLGVLCEEPNLEDFPDLKAVIVKDYSIGLKNG